ncbi:HK97 gp10 family phage protein [Bradyrhizobium sp. HKCCYLS2038]|uniref:HK97 gp10 family phage protein n=1 Tax=Bradyrhizobium sp. HKCCYLS2038 TaxID=3420764 RepID=UPI003EBA5C35
MSNNTFTASIAAFVEKAKDNADLVVRKVALEMFTRVVIKTPVDTGRARGSWQVAIGSVPAGQVNHLDKTGAETIARVAAGTAPAKAGDVIYLVANLPYINALEYGHSKQAPNGMVRLTIMEWDRVVSNAAQAVNK